MTFNDVLRRLRFTLNINNAALIELVNKGGAIIEESLLDQYLKREDEEGYVECSGQHLEAFLDGVIIWKRGPSDNDAKKPNNTLDNNMILRKLRIAFELRDTDMLKVLSLAEMDMSKSELSAFFRSPKHRNYMPCQSQVLRRFMAGLDKYVRQ